MTWRLRWRILALWAFMGCAPELTWAASCGPLRRLTFPAPSGGAPEIVVAADFNSDGRADLAVLGDNVPARIAIQRDRRLEVLAQTLTAVEHPSRALAEDFDNDGDIDLLVTCASCIGSDRVTLYVNRWAQRGRAGFTAQNAAIGLPALAGGSVPVAFDWDGDRDLDILLLATGSSAAQSVLLRNQLETGTLKFADESSALPSGLLAEITAATTLDINNDRRPDVYVARNGRDVLLVQQPDRRFVDEAATRRLVRAGGELDVAVADLDRRGGTDVVLLAPGGGLFALSRAKYETQFTETQLSVAGPASASGLTVMDITGDDRPEMIVTSGSSGTVTFTAGSSQQGLPTYAALSPALAPESHAGRTASLQIGTYTRALGFASGGGDAAQLCLVPDQDNDFDRMPDFFERGHGLVPGVADAREDRDQDDVPNALEIRFGARADRSDSDGDGVKDTKDLLWGTDFDGDGVPFERDNCPQIANVSQEDSDRNRRGDACDLGLRTLHEARSIEGDRALLPARETSWSRLTGDQKGLLPQGPSFRVPSQPLNFSMRELIELWHPQLKDHAYVVTEGEEQALLNDHYRRLGSLGYLAEAPFPVGKSVRVRRFVLRGARRDEAVTANDEVAAKLLAAGYREVEVLGHALVDEGRFTDTTRAVVRYVAQPRLTLHSSRMMGDVDTAGMESEGVKFRVLPEKSRWTIPLYRFRNPGRQEALTTDRTEFADLERRGFRFEGVIGHIFPFRPVETTEDLVSLARLFNPARDEFAHAVDSDELEELMQAGFSDVRVLGRAIRQPATRRPDPTRMAAVFKRWLASSADPTERAAGLLVSLVSGCAMERALTGQASTPFENSMTQIVQNIDAETRARLLVRLEGWHSFDASTRRAALGELAPFDPGDCRQPVDAPPIRLAVQTFMSHQGNLGPVFGNPMRAAQCAGTAADPRAISAVEAATVILPEGLTRTENYAVKPRLLGVRNDDSASSADGLDDPVNDRLMAYAMDHSKIGLPLIGVDVGPCPVTGQCPAIRGQRCVAGRCRAYPWVKPDGTPTFTGTSFWDKISAQLRFHPVDGGRDVDTAVHEVINSRPNDAQLPGRCDPSPAFMDAGIRSPRSLAHPGTGPDLFDRNARPNEEFVDTATSERLSLAPGRFYEVRLANQNGSYYLWNEQIDLSQDPRRNGRTIHVCSGNLCNPPVNPTTAACTTVPTATCSAGTGGLWVTPPRPLSACAGNTCPETPSEFVSDGAIDGLPTLIFVPDLGKQQWLNTRLQMVTCDDETGWDAFGEDELVLILASVVNAQPVAEEREEVADKGNRLDAWMEEFDSGDRKLSREFLSSLQMPFQAFNKGHAQEGVYVMQLGEDDDNVAQILLAGFGGAAATAGAGALTGPIGGAVAGVVATTLTIWIAATDPDDFLGQSAWTGTIPQVIHRGLLSHDINPLGPIDVLPLLADKNIDLRAFTPFAMSHPAADGEIYDWEQHFQTCSGDPDCSGGRKCAFHVCVKPDWRDSTDPPKGSTGSSGHMQYWETRGAGADYSVRLSFSTSDRKAERGETQ